MKYQLILISELRLMHQHMYSCIYGLAVKYFLQDAGGKNIIHYIYLKAMILIINYLLVKKYSKFLNLNLFLHSTSFFELFFSRSSIKMTILK